MTPSCLSYTLVTVCGSWIVETVYKTSPSGAVMMVLDGLSGVKVRTVISFDCEAIMEEIRVNLKAKTKALHLNAPSRPHLVSIYYRCALGVGLQSGVRVNHLSNDRA